MKRKTFWIVIVVVVIVASAALARAAFKGGRGWCGPGWHRGGPLGHVARELHMSKAQVAETRSIVVAERPTLAGLLKELIGEAHQMADATVNGSFDENKVQAIAATEGNTFAKLMVEKELIKSRIYATVLDKSQRKSADEMQQHLLDRLDHVVTKMQRPIQ
ncbi:MULTISPECIES: Spy/CpxP family protein refolding chaperone [Acidobacteriaceae]|uniref:Spy/CpxP family protein refolding chaperone n=1 Tax=Acidobacteriaceae TaxID=204434 RepID=UPI00131BCEC8|nr:MULTISPECIES: Spy/CpxP family protein refolding chaperone [Acidobacteriaceae]MDW5264276.1 Spy/CpxP family protein refolding chaperone [Edaphobacter sp.]